MNHLSLHHSTKLTVVIPCYNEEQTLEKCVKKVLDIAEDNLSLEIIIVDDNSSDDSHLIALDLAKKYAEIIVLRHEKNFGKGAALRTGFKKATGDFVAVQDADLEYDPTDLKRLLIPLVKGDADVVLGSRFLSIGFHRVLYFWHYMGNRFLTFLSNMFTDLNLTDMETCYKVFRREIIQDIDINEDRFGFEPEIIAKIAQRRVRIFEMGISYRGRTYEEGKKIGVKDGFRALYCIFRYNAHRAPLPIQLFIYFIIGAIAASINITSFLIFLHAGVDIIIAAPISFVLAAIINYLLCVSVLFRHRARWEAPTEILVYVAIVALACIFDLAITKVLITIKIAPIFSKLIATSAVFIINFWGRRFFVFPEPSVGHWSAMEKQLSTKKINA